LPVPGFAARRARTAIHPDESPRRSTPAASPHAFAPHDGPSNRAKDAYPLITVRRWFAHDPGRFEEFRRRYIEELRGQRPRLAALRRQAREGTLTLVYSAHDTEHNDAVVLAEVLRRGLPRPPMV
jgi:uncharacterized protein YeaO (DUF488 family)